MSMFSMEKRYRNKIIIIIIIIIIINSNPNRTEKKVAEFVLKTKRSEEDFLM